MPITKEKKKEIVNYFEDRFLKSKSVVFFGFQGLTVFESMELKKRLKRENIDCKVARKTLIKIGLNNAKFDNAENLNLEGPVAVAFGYEDEVLPVKLIGEYAKTNKKLKILGGYLLAKYMSTDEMKAVALLPDKNQLRAQLIGTINAPLSGFANVLSGNIRGLVTVLKRVREKKE